MGRTEKLNNYCRGRVARYVAKTVFGIHPMALSYLRRLDIDSLIAKIDALPIEDRPSSSDAERPALTA